MNDLEKLNRLTEQFGNATQWKILEVDKMELSELQNTGLLEKHGVEPIAEYYMNGDPFEGFYTRSVFVAIPVNVEKDFRSEMQRSSWLRYESDVWETSIDRLKGRYSSIQNGSHDELKLL
jgi:hypothetical protein